MLKKLSQRLFKNQSLVVLSVAIFLYLAITLPALFQEAHVMKNLEPYPDGLLFSLSARNLSMGKGLKLLSNWGEVEPWVPPLYSYYLSFFYLISSNVLSFYLANLILGIGTIVIIYLIIKKTSKNTTSLIAGLLTYFSHLVIFWLPSLAMTENLSLFLFSLLILGLLEKKLQLKLSLTLLASFGLLLVRLSTFPILLFSSIIFIFQLKNRLAPYLKQIAFFLILAILVGIYILQKELFEEIISTTLASVFDPNFFNFNFIGSNFTKYFKALFFHQGHFLWLQLGVTSWPISGLFLYSLYKLYKLKKINKFYILTALFLALLPLQLLFYTVDSRYLIYTILLFSLATAWLVEEIKNKRIIFLILAAVGLNIFFQKNLLKQLIADNWLGSSTAWQYKSILHFNEALPSNKVLITALPSFLVDAYQTKNYRTLPLSEDQEFLQKKQLTWRESIDYSNLISNYRGWLEEGRELYISNAYITHQQTVIQDFEMFKKEFRLELVSEGCLQACNIYRLELL